ncbi:hypothetical protein LJ656_24455 [Paraburkholderia sp. MMS20-SJTR3]|uniref:Lysine-specific metallo-endopeptidase domain-containing protein n=1 Tax=Paraburkholderia sejongensis TaxID=2886946 RepID=A0ABS8K0R1_9BURK|nr:M35 family metallo-endopeptidase [Paraburkholderia sp. MMS20-SJTR3]MCC8395740.1 hypothetical protein [Paraburkholderia sp. MMS20-SJTR3]
MNSNEYGFRVPTEVEDDDWIVVHPGTWTNTNPNSLVEVVINTTPICPNMSNKEFRKEVMRARDIGVSLIKQRIKAVALWEEKEQERAQAFFARSDVEMRTYLGTRLPRLMKAMQQLVPENIIRWDSRTGKPMSCSLKPHKPDSQASVCKPDSEKRIIAIHSAYCEKPFGRLSVGCKVKTIIHECTHFTDTFNSDDHVYVDSEAGARFWASNNPERAFENADSITGYIATFDIEKK